MSDLIDRKAAIDAIRKDMYADKDYMSALICDGIEDVLKSLPSAQPMMTNAADLINRGDAILAVYKRIKQLGMENDVDVLSIRQSIRDLASAQPYTEEQIQTMQDLESAEIEKAYELGRESEQQERKKGKWVYGEDDYGIDGYHCDKCGFFVPWDYAHKFINYIDDYNFCPNCGTCMKGEQT